MESGWREDEGRMEAGGRRGREEYGGRMKDNNSLKQKLGSVIVVGGGRLSSLYGLIDAADGRWYRKGYELELVPVAHAR